MRFWFALLALLTLSCGGGHPLPNLQPHEGIRLSVSDPGAPALAVLPQLEGTDEDAPEDALDGGIHAAKLFAYLAGGATAAAVNEALELAGASLIFSSPGHPIVTVQVPRARTFDDLKRSASLLRANGAFELVAPVEEVGVLALPPNIDAAQAAAADSPIAHQIAARVDAAWSAHRGNRPGFGAQVRVIVADEFSGSNAFHGRHVRGIILGDFGGLETAFGEVTGVVPFHLPVHEINVGACGRDVACMSNRIWLGIESILTSHPGDKFVLNMSLGLRCPVSPRVRELLPAFHRQMCGPRVSVRSGALSSSADLWTFWARRLNARFPTFDYERDLIQVSAAGNHGVRHWARDTSPWNASAYFASGRARLRNALVVENRLYEGGAGERARPGCLDESSSAGGTISAIGGPNVYSFVSATEAGYSSGTSMAAAQVAGVAAYMWAVRPTVDATEITRRILATAVAGKEGCATPGAPVLDAFESLLSMDTAADIPVRKALVQSTEPTASGPITIGHARIHLRKFFPLYYGDPGSAGALDFSTSDLNGDGVTGGEGRRPISALPGQPKANLTDAGVLCRLAKQYLRPSELDLFQADVNSIAAIYGPLEALAECDAAASRPPAVLQPIYELFSLPYAAESHGGSWACPSPEVRTTLGIDWMAKSITVPPECTPVQEEVAGVRQRNYSYRSTVGSSYEASFQPQTWFAVRSDPFVLPVSGSIKVDPFARMRSLLELVEGEPCVGPGDLDYVVNRPAPDSVRFSRPGTSIDIALDSLGATVLEETYNHGSRSLSARLHGPGTEFTFSVGIATFGWEPTWSLNVGASNLHFRCDGMRPALIRMF